MCHNRLSVLVVRILSTCVLYTLATPLSSHWDDIRVKHTWHAVPANREILGPPSAGTTIDIYVALKPHRENALIDALHKVSNPGHPKSVFSTSH